MFAGVNGANEYQGNPKKIKPAPRVGLTYAVNHDTVIRGGYGLFWAPWNYATTAHGSIGFKRTTTLIQSSAESEVPRAILDNPFPGGLLQPIGAASGLLTGVGGNVHYVDQTKGSPKVQQYSVDLQRELPGHMAITIGYVGATGRDIGFGGTQEATVININQIDPALARQLFPLGSGWDPAKLRESIPNPFFGIAAAGELGDHQPSSVGSCCVRSRNSATCSSRKRRRGAAVSITPRRSSSKSGRVRGLWGGRLSYTLSNSKDNQFGQPNNYAWRATSPQNNYDLDAEYGTSIYDSPHRIILAPIVNFPSPKDKSGIAYALAGGWNASTDRRARERRAVERGPQPGHVGCQPRSVWRPAAAQPRRRPEHDGLRRGSRRIGGSREREVVQCRRVRQPRPRRYGNAPRTNPDARFQFRKNIDLVLAKSTSFGHGQSGEIRFEILNLTNTAKFGNLSTNNAIDSSTFGRVDVQAGFMRIWQLSFRYRF